MHRTLKTKGGSLIYQCCFNLNLFFNFSIQYCNENSDVAPNEVKNRAVNELKGIAIDK